jgi:hypothetical protein
VMQSEIAKGSAAVRLKTEEEQSAVGSETKVRQSVVK